MTIQLRILIISALLLSNSVFANQDTPDECPAMSAIQREGIIHVTEVIEGYYLTFNLSHYETAFHWVFIMSTMMAESEEMALQKSNQMLGVMSGSPVPMQDNEGNWICEYETNNPEITAIAIHADDMMTPFKMRRYGSWTSK